MVNKKIYDVSKSLDIDIQLIASELNCSATQLLVLMIQDIFDSIATDHFNLLFEEVKNNGEFICSFDDNTDLFSYKEFDIILHSNLNTKCLIFHCRNKSKIENILNSYK